MKLLQFPLTAEIQDRLNSLYPQPVSIIERLEAIVPQMPALMDEDFYRRPNLLGSRD